MPLRLLRRIAGSLFLLFLLLSLWILRLERSRGPLAGEGTRPYAPGRPAARVPGQLGDAAAEPEPGSPVEWLLAPADAEARQAPAPLWRRAQACGTDLQRPDLHALAAWALAGPPPADSPAEWHAALNEVLQVLRLQRNPVPDLDAFLIRLAGHPGSDSVTRDYALQHLRLWCTADGREDGWPWSETQRGPACAALLRAARDTSSPLAGTALLALEDFAFAQNWPRPDRQTVRRLAIACAEGRGARPSVPARLTALQICARRGFYEAAASARNTASDPAAAPALRASAAAALGRLGSAADLPLLEALERAGDPRLAAAAAPARQRLQASVSP